RLALFGIRFWAEVAGAGAVVAHTPDARAAVPEEGPFCLQVQQKLQFQAISTWLEVGTWLVFPAAAEGVGERFGLSLTQSPYPVRLFSREVSPRQEASQRSVVEMALCDSNRLAFRRTLAVFLSRVGQLWHLPRMLLPSRRMVLPPLQSPALTGPRSTRILSGSRIRASLRVPPCRLLSQELSSRLGQRGSFTSSVKTARTK